MNVNKVRGTQFEYELKWSLSMLYFYLMRAYSSMGVADLVAVPPRNEKRDYRALLIQAKNTKKGSYVVPAERDNLTYLSEYTGGRVILAYKAEGQIHMLDWGTGVDKTFNTFMLEDYGITCSYKRLLRRFRAGAKIPHLRGKTVYEPYNPWNKDI